MASRYKKPSRAGRRGAQREKDRRTPIREAPIARPRYARHIFELPREGSGAFSEHGIYRPWNNNQPGLHDYTSEEGRTGWGRWIAERNLRHAEHEHGPPPEDPPAEVYGGNGGKTARLLRAFLLETAAGEPLLVTRQAMLDGITGQQPGSLYRGINALIEAGELVKLARGRYQFVPPADPGGLSCRMDVAAPQEKGAGMPTKTGKATTTRELFDAFQAAGFILERGAHNMKVFDKKADGQKGDLVTVLSTTPSDHRAIANGRAVLARLLRDPSRQKARTTPPPQQARKFPGINSGELPRSAYDVWQEMRQDAEYSGRKTTREGLQGWARPGGVLATIRKLWPQLDDQATRNAQQNIGEYLKLTGNLALIAQGTGGTTPVPPVWWVRDTYQTGPPSITLARKAAAGKPLPPPSPSAATPRPHSRYTLETVMNAVVTVTGGKETQFTTGEVCAALPSMHDSNVAAALTALARSDHWPVTKLSKGKYLHTPVTVTHQPTPERTTPMPERAPRRGHLRFEVLEYFKAHSGEILTAAKIGEALGASRGSISKILPELALVPETYVAAIPRLPGAYVCRLPGSDDHIEVQARQPEPETAIEPPEPAPAAPEPVAPQRPAAPEPVPQRAGRIFEEIYSEGDFVMIKDDQGNRYVLGARIPG